MCSVGVKQTSNYVGVVGNQDLEYDRRCRCKIDKILHLVWI